VLTDVEDKLSNRNGSNNYFVMHNAMIVVVVRLRILTEFCQLRYQQPLRAWLRARTRLVDDAPRAVLCEPRLLGEGGVILVGQGNLAPLPLHNLLDAYLTGAQTFTAGTIPLAVANDTDTSTA
jgi:hypothetical protein